MADTGRGCGSVVQCLLSAHRQRVSPQPDREVNSRRRRAAEPVRGLPRRADFILVVWCPVWEFVCLTQYGLTLPV